jgi:hypothetical protein
MKTVRNGQITVNIAINEDFVYSSKYIMVRSSERAYLRVEFLRCRP